MATRHFNGTSDRLDSAANIDLTGTNKVSLAFWLYWDAFANNDMVAFGFGPNGSGTAGGFFIDPNDTAGGKIRIGHAGNVGLNNADYTRPSAAVWHHWLCVFDKSQTTNECDLYLDGVLQTPTNRSSTMNNTDNFANTVLHVMNYNGSSLFAAGRVAEVALYPGVVLSANEAKALSLGISPRAVQPGVTPYYWPVWGLHSPEIDLSSHGSALTVTGTTTGLEGPPVQPFTRLERANAAELASFQAAWAMGANRLIGGGVWAGG